MRKFLALTAVLLKGGGGFFTNKRGKTNWIIPAAIILGFVILALAIMIFAGVAYDTLKEYKNGSQEIIIPAIFGATSVVIFLFGIFYAISSMYHAEDIEQLKYLPLSTYHILSAKFVTLVIYEYIFEAFILLPVIVLYGMRSGGGAMYIIYSVMLFLILPVIALSMAAVIVILVMRFTGFGKNKQAFKYAGGIIAVAFALGLNVLIQGSVSQITDPQFAEALRSSRLPEILANIFPGLGFASGALLSCDSLSGLWNLLLFALCSAGAFIVFLAVGRLLYLKGVADINETSAKRKAISDLKLETKRTPVFKAYVKKEVRLLFRSPTAFLQCILTIFIWPVLMMIILFTGGGEKTSLITGWITNMDDGLLVTLLAVASAFITSANAITSTIISREGKGLYFTKYIPVSMRKQLHAKSFTGIIFSGLSVAVFIAAVGAVIGINLAQALVSFVLGFVVGAACTYAGLLIDIANPKLEWVNEQQAIKQNMNVVVHLLAGLAFGALAIIPVAIFGMDMASSAVYILVVFTLLTALFIKRVNGKAAEKIIDMDV